MINSSPNTAFLIDLQLYDGNTSKFVRAYIKDAIGSLVTILPLTSKSGGLYTAQTSLPLIGQYTVQCIVYTDALFTIEDMIYERTEDQIGISTPTSINLQMTTGVIDNEVQELMAWLELDGNIITNPTSCSIQVLDGQSNVIFDMGINTTPLANGFFRYLKPSADTLLTRGESYVAKITIVHTTGSYSGMRGITVLS